MLLELSEQQRAIQRMIREFAEKEIAPYVAERERKEEFPRDLFTKMGKLGLTGLLIPEDYGGANLDRLSGAIIYEELGRVHRAIATISVHNMVTNLIYRFGNEKQRQRWVVPLAKGERWGAFCLTEPGAGSDAAAVQTRATRMNGGYSLNGSKIFITNAGEADTYLVAARTSGNKGAKGVSIIVVEGGTKGLSFGRKEAKLGVKASPTREVIFEDCWVPGENLIGEENQGFRIFMTGLDEGRVNVGAVSVGVAQGAFEAAVAYAKERVQFGRPIAKFQAIQFMLADMATLIEAARLLVWEAAYRLDQKLPATRHASMAKLFASEIALKVATDALQVFGVTVTLRTTRWSVISGKQSFPKLWKGQAKSSAWLLRGRF